MASQKILTPVGRLSFPSLWKATAMEGGIPQFSATLLFDEKGQQTPEFQAMIAAATEVKVAQFGANYAAPLRSPFRNGEEKVRKQANEDGSVAYMDGYGPGIRFVRISSGEDYPPTVYGPNKADGEIILPHDRKAIYAGSYCVAVVMAIAYDKGGNRGVKFGFSCLQKVGDGQSFGGGGSGAELLPDNVVLPEGATAVAAPATGASGDIDF